MNESSRTLTDAIGELGELNLPHSIELLEPVGQGECSITFRAVFRGEAVALKVYRPEMIEKFRKKYDLNIAVFEMSRNRKFRKVPELFPYSAKPIMVLGHDGQHSLCFMQEFIDGIPMTELARRNGGLPASVLEAGNMLAHASEQAGLKDLDLDYRNVLVRERDGKWLPVIHDFNRVPSDHPGTGAIRSLFKKAAGKSLPNSHYIREWRQFSEQCGG